MTTGLDVVIPTLNAAASLADTLAALGKPSGLSLTITVCDGGSRDATQSIAREAGARVVTAPPGRGQQLAAGAAAGQAPWLFFLHADSRTDKGWIDAINGFVADPDNQDRAAYFRLHFDSPDPRARRLERLVGWRSRTLGLPYGDQGLILSRTFYRRLGGFAAVPLMEDVDLVRRIGRRRLVPLAADMITSARRYERDGWMLRPLHNLSCLALYFAGVPPRLIRRLYG
ncbi:TIGR04283 family arsenosugar biosynthesis glycosyltransferase [Reyranella sp.]|uniref:TIGR04283 family arsenosugar biosynthesis glycosyltransferase n=1 Tax=Reyranella sp. TaxID=1929291 RepID=UPI003D145C23